MDLLVAIEPLIKGIHFFAAFVLVVSILLQPGKGGGLGAAFGVGASETLFGAQGSAKFLAKITVIGALVFLGTSMSLALVAKTQSFGGGGAPSVVETAAPPVP
jgi:preprotein translocase subunit SecG